MNLEGLMMLKYVKSTLIALALGGVASAAHAGTYVDDTIYYVQDANPTGSYLVAGQYLSGFTVKYNGGTSKTVSAGQFGVQTATSQAGPWTSLLTYCLDVDQSITLKNAGSTTGNAKYLSATVEEKVSTGSNDSFGQSAGLAATVDATVAKLWGNVFTTYASEFSATPDVANAALQLVLWEIFDEAKHNSTTYNLSSGDFRVTAGNASAIALAGNMLTSLSSWTTTASVLVLTNGTYYGSGYCNTSANQDFIVAGPPTSKVPEPTALVLVLMGLAATFTMRRQRARI